VQAERQASEAKGRVGGRNLWNSREEGANCERIILKAFDKGHCRCVKCIYGDLGGGDGICRVQAPSKRKEKVKRAAKTTREKQLERTKKIEVEQIEQA